MRGHDARPFIPAPPSPLQKFADRSAQLVDAPLLHAAPIRSAASLCHAASPELMPQGRREDHQVSVEHGAMGVVALVSKGAPAGAGASEIATVWRRAHLQSPPPCSGRIVLHLHGRDLVILVGMLVPVVRSAGRRNERMSKWVYV
eukprot:scaffold4545_cov111-Isochrysis_galbana.AAC.16